MSESLKRPAGESIATKGTNKKASLDYKTIDLDEDYSKCLNREVFTTEYKQALQEKIADATPYKWGSINQLVDESLLRNVRDEILREIHFTKKETDIYKVFQSGDLNNLNGLDSEELSKLPNLLKLRNALYCREFREMISYVTQAGAISSHKYDMSLNIYHKSCHLLTHDDVIGSRRVSFILYLPDPDRPWKDHYGGCLRLFGSHEANIPKSDFAKKFMPQFNDYAFFEVKPGYSFHDVEEVKADKQRISIQGWFHIPQVDEEGYIEGELQKFEQQSSLEGLESSVVDKFDFPKLLTDKISYTADQQQKFQQGIRFEDLDLEYLGKFINPELLNKENLAAHCSEFCSDSMITLQEFLSPEYSETLSKLIKQTELETEVPKLSKDVGFPWKVAMPSVKRRFLYVDGRKLEPELLGLSLEHESDAEKTSRISAREALDAQLPNDQPDFLTMANSESYQDSTTKKLCELAGFFDSLQFKQYLNALTSLIPQSAQKILIRRFRPGSDFTLATTQQTDFAETSGDSTMVDAVLEGTLCLTPSKLWKSGEFGGYELCMNVDSEDNDPAVYRNASSEEDIIMNRQADWNSFTLMLKDSSILKFVKYVSYSAQGSRWDINCQWQAQSFAESDSEEEE
ncbi:oxidative DNA demethylase [Saccharomycopsis crataegensis]|uniref:uS12 prolyl 3,4-dihydroxylase n=1 Tax=Saccharomycopsis crataegensis TaxID=43959 RepID=A0AAV5QS62_9ASCO|nr:oxidative DNA demethylase [Saccharomycopsis crataegensis]